MKTSRFFSKVRLTILFTLLPVAGLMAANESYVQSMTGHLKKGDSLTVIDDKFLNLPLEQWNQLKHLSVDNVISFAIRRDTSLAYYTRPFTCTLNITIRYYTSRDQQNPKEIDSVKLTVNFDTVKGKPYLDLARYRFKNAFKVTVVINSINSPQWGDKLPDVFRLTNQIMVDRKYPVGPDSKGKMQLSGVYYGRGSDVAASGPAADAGAPLPIDLSASDGQIGVSWDPTDFPGAEEFDLEWTYIDALSDYGAAIAGTPGGASAVSGQLVQQWMLHDASRITTPNSNYTIHLPYQEGYVLFRLRKAWYVDKIRYTGEWTTDADAGGTAVAVIPAHAKTLNWQYTGAFAEEGKSKEVITYFDATQRSRQTVTLNNSDEWTHDDHQTRSPVAVVQETVYDIMGRPTVNVLPAPVKNSLLDFFPSFNKNDATNAAYRNLDIVLDPPGGGSCAITAPPMSTNSGASQYYSPANTFLDADNLVTFPFNPYIPDAEKYPFSLTEYMPDNTGRIRRQGGVGPTLRNGMGHSTNYFYGKPTASQLQRMFGMEAGDPSHYQKNMVIDPNGQASVSYIDANGKTVATALAGPPPSNLGALPSSDISTAKTSFNDVLIRPADMSIDAGNLSMSATASFIVETNDPLTLHYTVDPLALVTTYGGSNQLCSNCYYSLKVTATDDCGTVVGSATSTPFQGSDYTCHDNAPPITQDLSLTNVRPGELYVNYSLQLSQSVIDAQTDHYVQTNTDLRQLQNFFQDELYALDLKGCYNTCNTCKSLPPTLQAFTVKIQALLAAGGFPGVTLTTDMQTWIANTYSGLVQNCAAVSCAPASPCEQKLDQLKQDVLPGGQYAPYSIDLLSNGSPTVFLEPKTNVMMQYNLDPVISALVFTAPDGSSKTVGSLTQADFVRAYLQNPQWADYFVKFHIEYCSYLWCKDASSSTPASNNEVSYTFDDFLQQNYANGQDAASAGYYDHSNPLSLLGRDPWFNGGKGLDYRSSMQSDLQNLSTVLGMTPKDASGNLLAAKNIIQLVDWLLYCKPSDPGAPPSQIPATWSACSPSDNCRSVTMEWTLYLKYYLQLKSKYYRIAKAAYFAANPLPTGNTNCLDCFIGSNALSAPGCPPPGAINNYSVVRQDDEHNAVWYIKYNGGAPFPGNYTISWYLLPNGGFDDGTGSYMVQTSNVTAGATGFPINTIALPTDPNQQLGFTGAYYILGVACTPTAVAACAASQATPPPVICPPATAFSFQQQNYPQSPSFMQDGCSFWDYQEWIVYSGPTLTNDVTVTVKAVETVTDPNSNFISATPQLYSVTLHAGQTSVEIGDFEFAAGRPPRPTFAGCENRIMSFGIADETSPSCPAPQQALPASSCTADPNYALYLAKTKVFDDYIDLQDYTSCLPANAPSGTQAAQNVLQLATDDLAARKASWLLRLQNIRQAEFSDIADQLPDNVLSNVVDNCYQISNAYLQYAVQGNLPLIVVSNLPATLTPPATYRSFDEVFAALIPTTALRRGFGADLLDNVYPYNKQPYPVDPNISQLTSDIYLNVKNNLAAFQSAWNGQGTFGSYLKAQLGDDYQLSDDQLSDLQARLAGGCPNPYLANTVILPVSFVLPPAGSGAPVTGYVTCTDLTNQQSAFNTKYPNLTQGTQLYQVLYTSFLNHQFGYALSFADYVKFACPATAFLYDKPQTPSTVEDVFDCAANQIQGAYFHGGQDYDIYIAKVRIAFRNAYVSKCLSNQASANMEGKQYEYHYTLYYYDQSGNLAKTIPPEGVHLLSDQDVAKVATLPAQDPASCAVFPSTVLTDQPALLDALSTNLQNNTANALEMWLYNTSSNTNREVRMVTGDNKFLCQAAIANGDVWFEVYTLQPDGAGGIDMTLTNEVVAALPAQLTLESWTHLVVASPNGIGSGALQLYVDGNKLTNLPDGSAPSYPVDWEINTATGSVSMPVTDISQAQSLRLYNRVPRDEEVVSNYQSSCMSPQGDWGGAPLLVWGLFNPASCTNVQASNTAVSIADRGALTVTSNPNPTGPVQGYELTDVVNNFTVEFWVRPNANTTDLVPDPLDKFAGIDNAPPYAIFPTYGGTGDHADMGVAVGTNGITVYEHADSYLPGVLDWRGSILGWTHVAVVYTNGVPSLYVNGEWKATGNAPQKASISPSYNFGGGGYGFMPGSIDEVRIWSVVRTQQQIAASYQHSLTVADRQGLVGYWPMDNSSGSVIHDVSCGGHDATFITPALTWASEGAPMTETRYVPFAGRFIVPQHSLPTNYAYNSLNQVVQQTTPDGGVTNFVYDRLGRLSISQNAEQLQPAVIDANNPAGRFSYTRYDDIGRITEVGEKLNANPLSEQDARDDNLLTTWLNSGNNRQATVTLYDSRPDWAPTALDEGFPRKRVTATALLATGSNPTDASTRLAATYYRYDLDGNVAELMQENKQLVSNEQQFVTGSTGIKDIQYEYDLLSGKVNKVLYQDKKWDQFYYLYKYDADNRVIGAYTSRFYETDPDAWHQEALYRYYLHGPLARMELAPAGQQAVQGIDYAYTLQGWIKGVNGISVPGTGMMSTDMSSDGIASAGTQFNGVGRDLMAYSLNYFPADYKPVGSSATAFNVSLHLPQPATGIAATSSGLPLYNGNIGSATYSIGPLESGSPVAYYYLYDQLNRLTAMDRYGMTNTSSPGGTPFYTGATAASTDYQERIGYDGNGNILSYTRNGTSAGGRSQMMDALTYNYNRDGSGFLLNNRLRHITDAVNPASQTHLSGDPQDLTSQPADNYQYDHLGSLIGNSPLNSAAEQIQRINWTVHGKMASIAKGAVQGLTFGYDPGGNRITKTATAADGSGVTTHYVRDAQGNVLAAYQYKSNSSGALTEADWTEQHLYGSSRLGMLRPGFTIPAGQALSNDGYDSQKDNAIGMRGNRLYELTNHLGNVLATITDKPLFITLDGDGVSTTAELLSAQDYYPFGMQMPGRTYLAGSSLSYRYGFNGKEKDDEVMGAGNEIDYGMRVYDPRAGKFLSVDPLQKKYPDLTPYSYASNRPVDGADLDGKEFDLKTTVPRQLVATALQLTQKDRLAQWNMQLLQQQVMMRQATLSSEPVLGAYQQQLKDQYRVQRYQGAGFNDDGSRSIMMRAGENKYVKNFADNIAFPLFEGYSFLDGLGELKAVSGPVKTLIGSIKLEADLPAGTRIMGSSVSKVLNRKNLALEWFSMAGKKGTDLENIMATIDFKKAVRTKVLNEGDYIWRFERTGNPSQEMHFFTDAYGADGGATSAGFGDASGYELNRYRVLKTTTVLESSIKYKGTTQYFSTHLQNVIEKAPL